jgi:hypothetical protein
MSVILPLFTSGAQVDMVGLTGGGASSGMGRKRPTPMPVGSAGEMYVQT